MSSPIIRCPVCRDAVQASEDAWDAHMRTHSTWAMLRATWRQDRRYAVLAVLLGALVVIAAALAWYEAVR